MNKKTKVIICTALAASVALVPAAAFAMGPGGMNKGEFGAKGEMQMGGRMEMPGGMNGQKEFGAQTASEAGTVEVSALATNTAEELTADYSSAETITMSDENNIVKIKASGTYIITGSCADGYIQVNKGVQDVVLVLRDLDLTSTSRATLSINKGAEVKIIVSGSVSLTDAETDENAEDYDGAVIKAKAGSSTALTGTGTLNLNGNSKNGIKVSGTDADDTNDGYSDASFIIDGSLTINVTAANDGMNSGTDLTIKSGTINVSAGDDGIKADYILTIGEDGEEGPAITVSKAYEGLEGEVINIYSGIITVTASDDGINAAKADTSKYTPSINIMGGEITVSAGKDGLDSNGNINILGGSLTIAKAASNGGDGGIDYDGSCYISEDASVNNPYGTTMDSGMGGMRGGMQGGLKEGMKEGMQGEMQGGMKEGLSRDAEIPAPELSTEQQNLIEYIMSILRNLFR